MNKQLRFLTSILIFAGASLASDYTSWAKYRNLTLSTTGITTTQVTKIPVLLRFNITNQFDMFMGSTAALANGADIRITKSDGTTDIPFEIESWVTGASGTAAVWILLDTVVQNNATAYSFRVYWNKASVTTSSSPSSVFSPGNGYTAVWHFNEAAGSPLQDATGNGNTATPGTGAAATDSANTLIGSGKTFNGSSQFYQVGTDSTFVSLPTDTGSYTITAWANPTSCAARIAVIAKYANDNSTATRQFALQTANTATDWRMTSNPSSLSTTTSNNEYVADVSGGCVEGTWSYLVGSYSSSVAPTGDASGAAKLSLSMNAGTPVTGAIASQATGTSIGKRGQTFIGKIGSNERYMSGTIDEITVSKVVRAADWIKLSYETQKAASTLVTVGASVPPTGAVAPGAPTGVTGTGGTTSGQIAVAWTAPTSNGGGTITGYTATAVQDTTKKCTTTGALTCNVTGLTPTTAYSFTVTATNSAGTGPASTASTPVPSITVPGVPTNVTGVIGNAQVTVSWTAPASTGGSAVTGYKAMAVSDTTKSCSTTGALTCNVTGLTNGTAYTFVVKATNAAGTSAASTASSPVTPAVSILFPSSQSLRFIVAGSRVALRLPAGVSSFRISVADLAGREAWGKSVTNGSRVLAWDGKTANGSPLSGTYVVRITTGSRNPKVLAESKITLTP